MSDPPAPVEPDGEQPGPEGTAPLPPPGGEQRVPSEGPDDPPNEGDLPSDPEPDGDDPDGDDR